MDTKGFISLLKSKGFDFFTGVPCSILGGLIERLEADTEVPYIPATREDGAVGMAAGAYMAGKMPALLMQNSGLGYCLNAFTSLNLIYRLPALVIVSWRGYQGKDAPEHLIMGQVCTKLLEDVGMPYTVLEAGSEENALDKSLTTIKDERIPHAIFLRKGVITV